MPTAINNQFVTNQDIKNHLIATGDLKYPLLEKALKSAYTQYILPIIDLEMIDDCEDEEAKKEAFEIIKKVIINLAMAKSFFRVLLQADGSGIRDNTAKESRATKEDKEALQNSYYDDGYYAIEELLIFLEQNKEHFENWKDSIKYTSLKNSFLPTALIFNNVLNIYESRRIFLMLKPNIHAVETRRIKKLLTAPLYNKLLNPVENDPNAIEPALATELIEIHIRPIVANLSMASCIRTGAIQIINNSFVVYDDTNTNKTKAYRTADPKALLALSKEYETVGEEYITELIKFIDENKQELGLATPSPDEGTGLFINDPNCSIVFF